MNRPSQPDPFRSLIPTDTSIPSPLKETPNFEQAPKNLLENFDLQRELEQAVPDSYADEVANKTCGEGDFYIDYPTLEAAALLEGFAEKHCIATPEQLLQEAQEQIRGCQARDAESQASVPKPVRNPSIPRGVTWDTFGPDVQIEASRIHGVSLDNIVDVCDQLTDWERAHYLNLDFVLREGGTGKILGYVVGGGSSEYKVFSRDGGYLGVFPGPDPVGAENEGLGPASLLPVVGDGDDWVEAGIAVKRRDYTNASIAIVVALLPGLTYSYLKRGKRGLGVLPGDAGAYDDLRHAYNPHYGGPPLEQHHMPASNHNFTGHPETGGALAMEVPEHYQTRTHGWKGRATILAERGLPFRVILARDLRDVRRIVGSKYDQGLRKLLEYYYNNYPHLIRR